MKEKFLREPKRYSPKQILEISGIKEPPVDLSKILTTFGISQDQGFDFDKLSLSGYIHWSKDRKSVELWVNPIEAEVRQRFTLSHELGHLFQHMLPHHSIVGTADSFEDTPSKFHRDGSTSPEEREANQFAAQLLMPAEMLRKHAKELADSNRKENGKIGLSRSEYIERLASAFKVSKQAMEIRLKTLNVLS